uniref:(northern house mosquito) hypothetical protein n=1 Tax=Culex pipiens TaxID=7175 RepID=A0A8D8BIG7_CULPI
MCDQAKPRKKKEKFQYNKSIMAATSVVVLDRGNNTTCTINLHGATVVSWRVNNQEQLFVRTFPVVIHRRWSAVLLPRLQNETWSSAGKLLFPTAAAGRKSARARANFGTETELPCLPANERRGEDRC